MSAQLPGSTQSEGTLPTAVNDFILALIRAINTGRLYAAGHELFAKHVQQLNARLRKGMTDRDSLFIGLARDTIFFQGSFYKLNDPNVKKFLAFFHFLGISYLLVGKRISDKELESFVGILAGAKKGQGKDVVVALARESVKNARVGLLDYAIFSSIQAIASRLTQEREDEALWRQLILQPAGAGSLGLSEEQTQRLVQTCGDPKALKEMFLQLDEGLAGIGPNHRGMLFNNFIQNMGNILSRIDTARRKSFAVTIREILGSLGSRLKIEILGSSDPDDFLERESDIVGEILDGLTEDQLLGLLREAIKETGIRSAPFNNLFKCAISRYRDPGLLLDSVRAKIKLATQERTSQDLLTTWQHLEQLLVRQQEISEFHARYREQIEGLAASVSIKGLTVEYQEIRRLLTTLSVDSLRKAKASLIIDLIGQSQGGQNKGLVLSLLERLGELLVQFLNGKEYMTAGDLVRNVYLAMGDYPEGHPVGEKMKSLLSGQEVESLFTGLMAQCNTFSSRETAALDALCRLFPLKVGDLLIDSFLGLGDDQDNQAQWLRTSLASLGSHVSKTLIRKFQKAQDHEILRLLDIAALLGERDIAQEVIGFLEHPKHEIRLKAIKVMGILRAEKAVPVLAEIVSQRSWLRTKKKKSLQVASANALAGIGTKSAKEVLHRVIREGPGDLRALCRDLI